MLMCSLKLNAMWMYWSLAYGRLSKKKKKWNKSCKKILLFPWMQVHFSSFIFIWTACIFLKVKDYILYSITYPGNIDSTKPTKYFNSIEYLDSYFKEKLWPSWSLLSNSSFCTCPCSLPISQNMGGECPLHPAGLLTSISMPSHIPPKPSTFSLFGSIIIFFNLFKLLSH